ncbi:MAG: hypothetical protein COV69_02305 [Parcubacteria group bacterium CG11_big_fil_rev_8_21_14_0_20_39_14]|nr:MAG: hypothetical protein COV69_02305 [Parcubacteria group bacterium CG11_big_fil_rev_8_21_14_0_20_39_14]PIS35414.1 MAG: hypothetical protein COT36_02460 [Parcubacteria group bacterium CG08_land_8_20_14_0_20_38_56]
MKALFKNLIIVVFILISLGLVFGLGYYYGREKLNYSLWQNFVKDVQIQKAEKESLDFSLFWEVWSELEQKFINRNELNFQKMIYGAISGMVKSLNDPYTQFLDPEQSKIFLEDVSGSFEGIGAEIGLRKNQLQIIAPLEGTPAKNAGLRSGDKILKIDDKITSDLTLDQVVMLIRGPGGTEVILTILRDDSPKEIKIIRDVIKVPTLKSELKDDKIAYIKIYSFAENLNSDFKETANKILRAGVQKIILDVRDNPGGYLQISKDIAEWFLKKGSVILLEDFGEEKEKKEHKTNKDGKFFDFPVVVLINQGSASASEILAGALRDVRGVILVGEKSFGKGSVQELEKFRDGSSIKITTARWLTPSGKSIMEEGLEPDIKIEMTEKDFEEGKDPQLEKALELIKNL